MPRIRPAVVALVMAVGCLSACSAGMDDGPALAGGESEVLGDADEGVEGAQAVRVYYSKPVHTESIVGYELRPPAGGIHNPVWWNCGFYDEPIPDEHAVHDLEHGVVWLAYAPDLSEADVKLIRILVRTNPRLLASPYPELADGEEVVATAWARQLRLDSVDQGRLMDFIDEYQDGDQAPEVGATCTGTPLGEPIP